ncbi:tetratricopeptide repeat protein [Nannocystaceae bacterium ST9]
METIGEYDRLLRFTQAAATSGFHIVLARYEHAEVARRTRAAAVRAIREAGIGVAEVDFAGADDDVDIGARLRAANEGAPIVFAVGLEGLLLELGVEPRATNAIARFNFDRDLLPERMHGVLVLWLSYRATRAFATFARDTFDVISTSFDFPEVLDYDREMSREFITMNSLPEWADTIPRSRVPELEERARLLESLYVDAEPNSVAAADIAMSLAKIEYSLGRMDDALSWFDRVALYHEQLGDTRRATSVRCWRASLHIRLGRPDLAEREIVLAKHLAEQSLDRQAELDVQVSEAELEISRGDTAQAKRLLENVVALTSDDALRATAKYLLAGIHMLMNEADAAIEIYDDLIIFFASTEKPWYHARFALGRATALAIRHQYDLALRTLREDVLPIVQRLGDVAQQARATSLIAAIFAKQGEVDQAVNLMDLQLIPLLDQLNDPDELTRAREFLAALRTSALSKDPG